MVSISVCLITYNQEATLAQAIDGILMQRGDFSLELVLGDDASSDETGEVCDRYKKDYPDTITFISHETNQGIVKNFISTIDLATGDYIAICAGDDYWIDPYKLQKQLQFFAHNPGYGVVTTGGYRLLVESNRMVEGIPPLNPVPTGDVFHLTHTGGVYALPLSMLFERRLLQYVDFSEFIKREFSCEDVPLQAIMAKHTRFGHIPDLTCVYRVYRRSMTFTNYTSPRYLAYHKGLVAIKRYLNELYPGEIDFSEDWAHDYMAYRRFLVAVFNRKRIEALTQLAAVRNPTRKERKAIRFLSTLPGFHLFYWLKRIKLWYHEKKNT